MINFQKQVNERSLISQIRGTQLASAALANSVVHRVSVTDTGLGLNQSIESTVVSQIQNRRESVSDEQQAPEPVVEDKPPPKKGRGRRSSIPDLVGVSLQEAKKFMWGSKTKTQPNTSSTPDRPHVSGKDNEKALFSKRADKRTNIKQFTVITLMLIISIRYRLNH